MKKKKLSVEPYKGTRDFYPRDMFIQQYLFTVMSFVSESYGYVAYGASILEETALYHAKSGEEIINEQTYTFTDRGGRDVTIRPEMTPTVARMVARKRKELLFPLRWYSIPNLFRYERPQRGRLREHWQLNVDLFGQVGGDADAEIIAISYDIMKAFGASDEQFIIKINNRKLLNFVLSTVLELDDEGVHSLSKLIDRKDKMKRKEFVVELQKIVLGKENAVLDLLDMQDISQLGILLPKAKMTEGYLELCAVFEKLKLFGITNIMFDFSLVRGFDYYTGTIFEVFDTGKENKRSLFGGGRYDDLVKIFAVDKVPAVGFGMGDVPIRDFLQTYNLLPEYQNPTHLYVCVLDEKSLSFAQQLARTLRGKGINVWVDYTFRKVGAQIKSADRQSIPFVICIGDNEVISKEFKVKNLRTGKQFLTTKTKLAGFLRKNL